MKSNRGSRPNARKKNNWEQLKRGSTPEIICVGNKGDERNRLVYSALLVPVTHHSYCSTAVSSCSVTVTGILAGEGPLSLGSWAAAAAAEGRAMETANIRLKSEFRANLSENK